MSYHSKMLWLVVVAFLAFFALGIRRLPSMADASFYVVVASSSMIYVAGVFACVCLARVLERVHGEKKQFALVILSAAAAGLAFVVFHSALPSDSLIRQLTEDLPKLAIVVPLVWIVGQERRAKNG